MKEVYKVQPKITTITYHLYITLIVSFYNTGANNTFKNRFLAITSNKYFIKTNIRNCVFGCFFMEWVFIFSRQQTQIQKW